MFGTAVMSVLFLLQKCMAQTPPITSSGFETTITQNGSTYNITGGIRPGSGTNLFHSFGEFNVPNNQIVNFLNETPALATLNILGRVTGGNISNIFGTIQTTAFPGANLFLMNPAGFLFGPNASLNVGGMVNFTSADYLQLADSVRFNAIPNATADGLLSTAPVAEYGFLGSNPGAITVQGSRFRVSEGEGISLVGGTIMIQSGGLDNGTFQSARIMASGGSINLANAASHGEVSASTFLPDPGMSGGSITLSQESTLNVSGNGAGTVRIRGGQLHIADATIFADTGEADGALTVIDINILGKISLADSRATPVISARTTGTGNAGKVHIESASLEASTSSTATFALIDTHTSGTGKAGSAEVRITDNLKVSGTNTTEFSFIDSGTAGPGNGGDVRIDAKNIDLRATSIKTGDASFRGLIPEPSGSGGNLTIETESLQGNLFRLTSSSFTAIAETQDGGDIRLSGRANSLANINFLNGVVAADGIGRGGAITLTNIDSITTDFTVFETSTVFSQGGGITANGRSINLTNGSSFTASTFGDGAAGNIDVIGTDNVSLVGVTGSNPLGVHRPSGLFSNSFGDLGNGKGGDISITTPVLTMNEGRVNTSTASSGNSGTITTNAAKVTISGEFPLPVGEEAEPIFNITNVHPSGFFAKTVGSELCSGACGNAGNMHIHVDSLVMGPGSQIDNGTSSTGHGGQITITATDSVSISGTLSDRSPVGIFSRSIGTAPDAGPGGDITLTAGQSVTILNGASVSAGSTGLGDAGNISINAGQQLDVQDGSITTEALKASGGNIDIRAVDRVRFVNSQLSASVGADRGNGGNITIDPKVVILQNSDIRAQAVEGRGGDITIRTPVFLADQTSLVDASSQFGLSGTVTIQSPTSNLSGTVKQLTTKPSETQALLQNRCVALAGGEQSTFIVAGRDALPSEPGVWLSSPLSLEHLMGNGTEHAAGPTARNIGLSASPGMIPHANKTEGLSLRRLMPPGFLVRAFATGSTGCPS